MKAKDQICPICESKMKVEVVSRFGDRVNVELQCTRLNCPRHVLKVEQRPIKDLELEE